MKEKDKIKEKEWTEKINDFMLIINKEIDYCNDMREYDKKIAPDDLEWWDAKLETLMILKKKVENKIKELKSLLEVDKTSMALQGKPQYTKAVTKSSKKDKKRLKE